MSRHLPARLLFCLLTWAALALPAAAQPVEIHDVRVGFPVGVRDFHRSGSWTPVAVEFMPDPNKPNETVPASIQGRLTVEANDGEGAVTRYTVPVINVSREDVRTRKPFLAYIKLGSYDPEIRISFEITQTADERGNVTKASRTLSFQYPEHRRDRNAQNTDPSNSVRGDQRFILTLGNVAGPPVAARNAEESLNYQAVQQTDPQRLPAHWFGYEGIDVILLGTGGTWAGSLAEAVSKDEALRTALLQWVAQGGHLVIGVSSNATHVQQSPLAALYPAEIDPRQVFPKAKLEELQARVSNWRNVQKARKADIQPLTADLVLLKEKPTALALVSHENKPVIVQAPFGLGRVTFLAFDIDSGSFLDWENGTDFWKGLLSLHERAERNFRTGMEAWDKSSRPGMKAAEDFAHALEQFGEMPVVSFFLVAVFILGYIVLIGPVDYFFLKKVAKRLEWTWITFPALVLLVSVGAYLAAYYIKGDEMRLNKVDLIDLDLSNRRVAGNSWVTVFSPNLQKYDLQVLPEGVGQAEGKPCMSWLGRPGTGLRGFDRQQSAGLFRRDYAFGPEAESLLGVPIQVWGMKTVTARWHTRYPQEQPLPLEARFRLNEQLALTGEIKSRLPVALKDCRLIYDNHFWELGSLEAGGTLPVTGSGIPLKSQNAFRPLQAQEVSTRGKVLAEYAGPLSDLLHPDLAGRDQEWGTDRNRPPYYLDYLNQNWRMRENRKEAIFLATVDNRHGSAAELNAEVKFGTRLSVFTPDLRGTLRQATYLRVFVPVNTGRRQP